MFYEIKNNTIFIADSHYSEGKKDLKYLLEKLEDESIKCESIVFLGDVFDFLSAQTKYFVNTSQLMIDKINLLSKKYKIFYFEGNHDYNLEKLFPNVVVFKRELQPVKFLYKDKTVLISHGDIKVGTYYELFCKIIRNSIFLKFLNFLDINNFISKKIEYNLSQKNICKKIENFERIIENKYKDENNTDIIVEGHYHQGKIFNIKKQKYINVPSLFCSKKFLRIVDDRFELERY